MDHQELERLLYAKLWHRNCLFDWTTSMFFILFFFDNSSVYFADILSSFQVFSRSADRNQCTLFIQQVVLWEWKTCAEDVQTYQRTYRRRRQLRLCSHRYVLTSFLVFSTACRWSGESNSSSQSSDVGHRAFGCYQSKNIEVYKSYNWFFCRSWMLCSPK